MATLPASGSRRNHFSQQDQFCNPNGIDARCRELADDTARVLAALAPAVARARHREALAIVFCHFGGAATGVATYKDFEESSDRTVPWFKDNLAGALDACEASGFPVIRMTERGGRKASDVAGTPSRYDLSLMREFLDRLDRECPPPARRGAVVAAARRIATELGATLPAERRRSTARPLDARATCQRSFRYAANAAALAETGDANARRELAALGRRVAELLRVAGIADTQGRDLLPWEPDDGDRDDGAAGLLLGIADAPDGDGDALDATLDAVYIPTGIADPDDGDRDDGGQGRDLLPWVPGDAPAETATALVVVAKCDSGETHVGVGSFSSVRKEKPTLTSESDDAVITRALAAKNGSKLRRLLDGDASAHDGDRVRAVWALARFAVYWTDGDGDQAERIIGRSPLADADTRGRIRERIELAGGRFAPAPRPPAPTPDALAELARRADDAARAERAEAALRRAGEPFPYWTARGAEREPERAEADLTALAEAHAACGRSRMEVLAQLFDATNGVGRELGREVCERIATAALAARA